MSIARVEYRERQRLTAADLRAEQQYRLGLGGRHHLTHHQWGVVRGLRVLAPSRQPVVLTPGVAIDGYGREILVRSPVELSVRNGASLSTSETTGLTRDPARCWGVVLYYCESPEQVPAERACREDPAPRIRQHFTWVVEEVDRLPSPPSGADDLTRAQAAGGLPGLAPWPVLVATIGRSCEAREDDEYVPSVVSYSRTRYVRHRAGIMLSPTGRAALQLGLAGRTDVYHFALSTKDDGKDLLRRIAIDRDGTLQVWRPLVVSGANAVGEVAFGPNRMLRVTTVMPAGIGRRVHIDALLDPADLMLTASVHDTGERRAVARPALVGAGRIQKTTSMRVPVRFGAGRIVTFELLNPAGEPRDFVEAPKHKKAAALKAARAERVSVELPPTGGKLVMAEIRPAREARPAVECGDGDRARPPAVAADLPVVQFRPAKDEKAVKSDPLAREAYAVTSSAPSAPVPETELRLSGGAEDESDASSRLSVGFRDKDDPTLWHPALRMDGGRRIEILAGADGGPHPVLRVDDTVYLPPIGKDDPLLPEMLAMAFMAGLRQIGAGVADVTVTLARGPGGAPTPGAVVTRGKFLSYWLIVKYKGTIQVKRAVETIRGTAGTGDMSFRSLRPFKLASATTEKTRRIRILKRAFMHPASHIQVQVQLLLKKDNATGVVVSNTFDLDVVDS